MQNSYIAIDGGTTNTRLTLVSGHTVQGTAKYAVGVSDAVRDRAVLAGAVRDGIRELLRQTGVCCFCRAAVFCCRARHADFLKARSLILLV